MSIDDDASSTQATVFAKICPKGASINTQIIKPMVNRFEWLKQFLCGMNFIGLSANNRLRPNKKQNNYIYT
ncbi:MAG: hypothetical protein COB89_04635 [Piscirickettsiaceae bacterium]|nr:MAG: hypothetical protein COB89_04635 [Piscirickettsiaceae bacterium]